jgi:hypothetical protein
MKKKIIIMVLTLVIISGIFSGCTHLSDNEMEEIKEQIKASTPIPLTVRPNRGTDIYLIGQHNSSNPITDFIVEVDWLSENIRYNFSLKYDFLNKTLPESIQNITSKIATGGRSANKWDDEFILYDNGQFSNFTMPGQHDGAWILFPIWLEMKDNDIYFVHEKFSLYWTEADRDTQYTEMIRFDFCYYNVELLSQFNWEIPSGYNMTIDVQWIEDHFSDATNDQLDGWYKVRAYLDHDTEPWLDHNVMLWYNIDSLETKMVKT